MHRNLQCLLPLFIYGGREEVDPADPVQRVVVVEDIDRGVPFIVGKCPELDKRVKSTDTDRPPYSPGPEVDSLVGC